MVYKGLTIRSRSTGARALLHVQRDSLDDIVVYHPRSATFDEARSHTFDLVVSRIKGDDYGAATTSARHSAGMRPTFPLERLAIPAQAASTRARPRRAGRRAARDPATSTGS